MTVLKTSLIGVFLFRLKQKTFAYKFCIKCLKDYIFLTFKEIYDIDEDGDPYRLKNTFALVAA